MPICTFFGHRECYDLDAAVLRSTIEDLIKQGVSEFLVGHQGQFDAMVRSCLKALQIQYPEIRYSVVLAYLPTKKQEFADFSDTIYPEGLETVPPRYAVSWRNRYLINMADICICYVNRTYGGAYQFYRKAKSRGLTLINLGNAMLEKTRGDSSAVDG